jgi:hypothetical protein
MKGQLREIRPGEVFYLYGSQKIHFVGAVQGLDEKVYIFWEYNKYKKRRLYSAFVEWELEILWEYLWKTKTRRKLIY